ncbi:B3 DNA binding domain - like 10 [Theobroma cacao]|nr:B3 DNA binding domain - like 10 [Theobroma cacao]
MALHFTKKLSKTDVVEKRLSLPTKYMRHLPGFRGGHAVNLPVMDVHGTEWHFRYSIRRKGHPKPVLSTGWGNFVKSKCLRPGDRIIIKMEANVAAAPGPLYIIGVKRRMRLLGKEVWTAVF